MKEVPGFSRYIVYPDGKVWSKERVVRVRGGGERTRRGRWMVGYDVNGYECLHLTCDNGRRATYTRPQFLYMAYSESYVYGLHVRFKDGDKNNLSLDNLYQVYPDAPAGVKEVKGHYVAVIRRRNRRYIGPERQTREEALHDYWAAWGKRYLPTDFQKPHGAKKEVWRVNKRTFAIDYFPEVVQKATTIHYGDGTWHKIDGKIFVFFWSEAEAVQCAIQGMTDVVTIQEAALLQKKEQLQALQNRLINSTKPSHDS